MDRLPCFNSSGYWQEIENSVYSARVKDVLKGLVNCHLNRTIPPTLTPTDKLAMVAGGPRVFLLYRPRDGGCGVVRETLTVMHYIPDSADGREFLYLAEIYPGGKNIPLAG